MLNGGEAPILRVKSSMAQYDLNGAGQPLYPRLSTLGCVTSFFNYGGVASAAVQLRQL